MDFDVVSGKILGREGGFGGCGREGGIGEDIQTGVVVVGGYTSRYRGM